MTFIKELKSSFSEHQNPVFAKQMKSYMLNLFEFYGIRATQRRELLKNVYRNNQDEVKTNIRKLSLALYNENYRELHISAIELFEKELRNSYKKEDINYITQFITKNSHWDSVDFIAKKILGHYLHIYHDERDALITTYSTSNNMWLNRSAILFQLGYKANTNKDLLFKLCVKHKNSNAFFIQKAIGWSLREYAKTNPIAVKQFVKSVALKPLSTKEALKHIN